VIYPGQSSEWSWTNTVLPLCSSQVQLQNVVERQTPEMGSWWLHKSRLNRMSFNLVAQYVTKFSTYKIQGGMPFGAASCGASRARIVETTSTS
jgi:hypothetical protein